MIGKTGKDFVLRVATPGRLEGRTRCGRAHQEHREVLQHETGTESSGKDFGPRVRRNSKECKQILPPSSREHTGAEAGGEYATRSLGLQPAQLVGRHPHLSPSRNAPGTSATSAGPAPPAPPGGGTARSSGISPTAPGCSRQCPRWA